MQLAAWASRLTAIAAAAVLFTALPAIAEEDKDSPFGERKKKPPPKPAERTTSATQTSKTGSFAYEFDFKPGIPDPGLVTEIIVSANEIPKTPHPRFGSRVPLQSAHVVIELTSPAGELVGRYLAHPLPLQRGKYGLHVTPAQDGIYTLRLVGKTESGAALEAETKLPVNVWPLPPELVDTDQPIADIAVECGFSDQANLTRLFGRLIGETPAKFRAARNA